MAETPHFPPYHGFIDDDEALTGIILCSLFPTLATLIVFLRLYLRRVQRISLGWDDFFIVVTVVGLACRCSPTICRLLTDRARYSSGLCKPAPFTVYFDISQCQRKVTDYLVAWHNGMGRKPAEIPLLNLKKYLQVSPLLPRISPLRPPTDCTIQNLASND